MGLWQQSGVPHLGPDATLLTAAEQALLDQWARWQQEEGGYAHMQGPKPQPLAYGLNDSPAGLAAWIVEKYRTWSDCNGDVEARYTKDELLPIVTLYWVTQTISSSTRRYTAQAHRRWGGRCPAPGPDATVRKTMCGSTHTLCIPPIVAAREP